MRRLELPIARIQPVGPSKSDEVYELDFTPENVQKLYEKVEDENVMFVLKDLKTQEAKEVKWVIC